MFADCPRRYYLSRYLGFEPRPAGRRRGDLVRSRRRRLGQQVHALLAGAVVASPDPEAANWPKISKECAGQAGRRGGHRRARVRFPNGSGRRGAAWPDRSVVRRSRQDRAGGLQNRSRNTAERRGAKYGLQLRLYALALERLTGRAPAEAYLCFLRADTRRAGGSAALAYSIRPKLPCANSAMRRSASIFPYARASIAARCPHFTQLCPARLASEPPASPNPA